MSDTTNTEFIEPLQANPLATVSDYYASHLAASPKAIDYLKRHALHCQTLPTDFSDRSLGNHISVRCFPPTIAVQLAVEVQKSFR